MKKIAFIAAIIFSISSCNLFSSSSNRPDFKYSFETAKDHYIADSTSSKSVHIKAIFTNQSNQTLYLGYQTGLEKRYTPKEWKAITIPLFYPAVARGLVKVKPGKSEQFGINLGWWSKPVKPLQSGIYRFTLAVKKPGQKKFLKIHSNPFEISY